MKIFKRAALICAPLLAMHAFADTAPAYTAGQYSSSSQQESVTVEKYAYGANLDIAKVLSVTDTQKKCGPTKSTMYYRDSSGALKGLEYKVLGSGCIDN